MSDFDADNDGLFLLFLTEARDHMDAAEEALLALGRNPEDHEAIQSCFRSLHSLKGCSSFFQLENVERIAHACEQILAWIRERKVAVGDGVIKSILNGTERLSQILATLARLDMKDEVTIRQASQIGSVDEAILSELDAVARDEFNREPESQDVAARYSLEQVGVNDERNTKSNLEEEFYAEAIDIVDQVESTLVRSEDLSTEEIQDCFRGLHTLKGIAAYLGRDRIERLSHLGEEEFVDQQTNKVSKSISADSRQRLLTLVDDLRSLINADAPKTAHQQSTANTEEKVVPPPVEEIKGKSPEVTKPDAEESIAKAVKDARHFDSYSRIATNKLEELVNLVGELVISHSMLNLTAQDLNSVPLLSSVNSQGRILRQLQGLALGMRMVPLRSTFRRLARAVHDAANKLGKEVDLVTEGEDTEIDRSVAENLADPLLHMVRNAVDHGIESMDERERMGKPRRGTITLKAYQSGEHVVIRVIDDGGGVDNEVVRRKAISRGLINSNDRLDEREIHQLLFEPGFTTRDMATDLSGRGVGLDVVKCKLQQLKGDVVLRSRAQVGSDFTVRVPLTTAILNAMIIRVGTERYLVPITSVVEALQADGNQLQSIFERGMVMESRGETLPVTSLSHLFADGTQSQRGERGVLLVLERFGGRIALQVDQIIGQQQVVIKPLPAQYSHHHGLSGSAILSDGTVGFILDPNLLLKQEAA